MGPVHSLRGRCSRSFIRQAATSRSRKAQPKQSAEELMVHGVSLKMKRLANPSCLCISVACFCDPPTRLTDLL